MTSNGTSNGDRNSALRKALTVLDLFARESRPLSAPAIGERLDLSRQAVHRILRQLEENELIQRAPDDRYMLAGRARRLALDIISASHISGAVRAILYRVVSRVNETCNVGMLDGYEQVYLDRVECNWPLRVPLRPGSRVPSHCTAIGKLLLAYLPARQRDRLLTAMPRSRYTPHTITERGAFEAHLADIRAQGYSINNQEDSLGLIAIAVPIRNRSGRVFAGLGVHGPEARFSIPSAKAHLPFLTSAAEELGLALEFESEPEFVALEG